MKGRDPVAENTHRILSWYWRYASILFSDSRDSGGESSSAYEQRVRGPSGPVDKLADDYGMILLYFLARNKGGTDGIVGFRVDVNSAVFGANLVLQGNVLKIEKVIFVIEGIVVRFVPFQLGDRILQRRDFQTVCLLEIEMKAAVRNERTGGGHAGGSRKKRCRA